MSFQPAVVLKRAPHFTRQFLQCQKSTSASSLKQSLIPSWWRVCCCQICFESLNFNYLTSSQSCLACKEITMRDEKCVETSSSLLVKSSRDLVSSTSISVACVSLGKIWSNSIFATNIIIAVHMLLRSDQAWTQWAEWDCEKVSRAIKHALPFQYAAMFDVFTSI